MATPKREKNAPDAPNVKKYYLTNATLLPEVIRAKKLGKITPELAKMLVLLAERYSRHYRFSGYSYRDDMVSEALANLCQNALKFNPERSSNPFAFYTTAIHRSFLQYLNIEKRHRNIRDSLLIELGENPSFSFLQEHQAHQGHDDEVHIASGVSELQKDVKDALDRTAGRPVDERSEQEPEVVDEHEAPGQERQED